MKFLRMSRYTRTVYTVPFLFTQDALVNQGHTYVQEQCASQ